jgi:hypothetical protein
MFGYLGLSFPDVDLAFLGLLNHRSILTHSILLPVAFLTMRNDALRFGASGFVLGVSVHLAADVLADFQGFGLIWLPWPIKMSIGPILSPVWLAANAIVGLVWAKTLFLRLDERSPLTIYWMLAWILAPSYSIFHEDSLLPLGSFAIIFGVSWLIAVRLVLQPWFKSLPQVQPSPPTDAVPETQMATGSDQAAPVLLPDDGSKPEKHPNATPWVVGTSLAIIVILLVGMTVGGPASGVAGLLSVGVAVLARRMWRNKYRGGGM